MANASGQVAGEAQRPGDLFAPYHAFLYDATATPPMRDLGTLGGTGSGASGINDASQVVGSAWTPSERHTFLYDASATPPMQDLGTLGGTDGLAYGINNFGQVVGLAYPPGIAEYHAFLYDETATPPTATARTARSDCVPFLGAGDSSMPRQRRHNVRSYRPAVEVLEVRNLLSTYTVDHLADDMVGNGPSGSLRYCMTQAADGDEITFGDGVTGVMNLAGALPDLAHSVSIQGPGADLLTVRRESSMIQSRSDSCSLC